MAGIFWFWNMRSNKTIVNVARDAILYAAISISLAAILAWLFIDKLSDFG